MDFLARRQRPALPSPSASDENEWRATWRKHRRTIILTVAVLLGISLAWGRLDLDDVRNWATHVEPSHLFACLVLLPLVTFPVTPLNLIAGVRFGIAGGMGFVAAAIVVQHGLAFLAARILPAPMKLQLEPLQRRLPHQAHADAVVFASLLPGAPYWAQLYVLPVIGVPFVTYLLVSAPLHMVRSIIAVTAGELSEDPSWGWFIALGLYSTALAATCLWAGRRLRTKYKSTPKTAKTSD